MRAAYRCTACGHEWQGRAGPVQCEQHQDGPCPSGCPGPRHPTACPACGSAYMRWTDFEEARAHG